MRRVKVHGLEPSATDGQVLRTVSGGVVWDDETAAVPEIVLLEVGEDDTDVPPGTPVGAIVFRKV